MEILLKYFPELTPEQHQQFAALRDLYTDWNSKINLISRKDIECLYEHHVLHSLALARIINFAKNTKILDVGTGGGFPGIPLAILFPSCNFHLVDSIGKKIKVVENVSQAIGLSNVKAEQARVENLSEKYDFVVSRAVTTFPELVKWTRKLVRPGGLNTLPNGFLYLKGGDFEDEIKPFGSKIRIFNISDFFTGEYFETKKIIYLEI